MKTLVVARHEEGVGWYKYIPSDWKIMEVKKGREVPNTGRECSSFLWAILRLYDTLADSDLVGFVQGDPYPHCADIELGLLLDRPTDGFRALGDFNWVSGDKGQPHHRESIPVADRYEEWFGKKWPGAVRFAPGGQFVVNGADIRAHPKEFYGRLLTAMDDGWNPWVLERLWPVMFPARHAEPVKATFYCQATPVTTYLRCELPARYLPGKVSRECVNAMQGDLVFHPDHEGVGVFQFAGDPYWMVTIHHLQVNGTRVMVESDDNYFAVAPTMKNTGWVKKTREGDHSIQGHREIVRWADGCIVTTEHLAKQYRKHNPNVYVCPNTIDPLDWPKVKKTDDGVLRIGWFASNSHVDDAKLVARALEWASKQKDVEVVTMGFNPSWRHFRRKHISWQNLPGYREALHELDIGLAPVVGTPWALGRSDLKALEYAYAGAAVVLSDVAPYKPWVAGENCLKAGSASDFYKQVRHLVQHRDEVKQLAKAGRDYVVSQRTTQKQIGLWQQAIDGVEDVSRKVAA
jgi:glycosyltransferase involved in cell wall biosynthesis